MAQIHVRWGYRGAPSRERYIPAGIYDENDERIFGLTSYLVSRGHAVIIADDNEETDDIAALEAPDLSEMTISEVKAWVSGQDFDAETLMHLADVERAGKNRSGLVPWLEELVDDSAAVALE